MTMPGFTADASMHAAEYQYRTVGSMEGSVDAGVVRPAFLNSVLDPCRRCRLLTGCARQRCFCICNDGDWIGGTGLGHCGFCT